MPTRAIENYLKQLYLEEQSAAGDRPVAMGRLAGLMGVVPGTATTMVKTLAESGLVHYSPREGVRLSRQGKRLAAARAPAASAGGIVSGPGGGLGLG